MIVNRTQRVIEVKLVYYGRALSGKTTNLQSLHAMLAEPERTPLTSLKVEGDRTLFFDFLPLTFEGLQGWSIQLKTYTVPGQPQYEATRRLILQGADGVVLVADSHPEALADNLACLRDMRSNLRTHGLDPHLTPLVLQYNKRDTPGALSLAAMDTELNPEGLPRFEAVATKGIGVRETFLAIAGRTVGQVPDRLKRNRIPSTRVQEILTGMLPQTGAIGTPTPAPEPAAPRSYDLGEVTTSAATGANSALLQQAVNSSVSLAGDLATATAALKRLERRRAEMAWLAALADIAPGTEDVSTLLRRTIEATGASAGSLLLATPGEGRLEEAACLGLARDPLNRIAIPGVGSLAWMLLSSKRAVVTRDLSRDLLNGMDFPQLANLRAVVAVPLTAAGRPFGMLCLHALGSATWAPAADELHFAQATAGLLVPHALAARRAVAAR